LVPLPLLSALLPALQLPFLPVKERESHPDHAFDGVTELPGCPPYSLLTIDEAADLAAWIEVTAKAWQ
jgi:hypothetical protein